MNDIEAAEREAFAKYITSQEHIGFDAVVWRGIGGDPLGVLHEPEYSENSLRSEWAAWLARSALAHAARGEGESPMPSKMLTEEQAWGLFLLGAENGGDPGWAGENSTPEQREIRESLRGVFQRRWSKITTPPPATGEAGTRGAR